MTHFFKSIFAFIFRNGKSSSIIISIEIKSTNYRLRIINLNEDPMRHVHVYFELIISNTYTSRNNYLHSH